MTTKPITDAERRADHIKYEHAHVWSVLDPLILPYVLEASVLRISRTRPIRFSPAYWVVGYSRLSKNARPFSINRCGERLYSRRVWLLPKRHKEAPIPATAVDISSVEVGKPSRLLAAQVAA